ncbi:MAG: alpha/beta hydrolase [Scytolyngbya sp. HA4215-MV1]|jgi:pimeloyl-ACP methyl ester carboxylesterase|nr:alpha/beta hydrolase [Scytolyngbya sp. HA4215-MV1]
MSVVQKNSLRFLPPHQRQPELPLFVFLPGMDGTGELLRTQIARLETAFDVRCLHIPTDNLTGWAELSENVIALVQAEVGGQVHRSIYLCGESFGGCLAIQVALRDPQLFHRIVLINPASSFSRRPWMGWGPQLTRWLPEPTYQLSSVLLLPLLASFRRMKQDDRQFFLKTVSAVPQITSLWRISLLSQFNVTDTELRRLTQPVLILASLADLLLPSLAEARRLETLLPDASVTILPESGHVCLLEAEINLYEILRNADFLEMPSIPPKKSIPMGCRSVDQEIKLYS